MVWAARGRAQAKIVSVSRGSIPGEKYITVEVGIAGYTSGAEGESRPLSVVRYP